MKNHVKFNIRRFKRCCSSKYWWITCTKSTFAVPSFILSFSHWLMMYVLIADHLPTVDQVSVTWSNYMYTVHLGALCQSFSKTSTSPPLSRYLNWHLNKAIIGLLTFQTPRPKSHSNAISRRQIFSFNQLLYHLYREVKVQTTNYEVGWTVNCLTPAD